MGTIIDSIKLVFEPLFVFKKKPCDCPLAEGEDPLSGTLFKHNVDGQLYKYVFAALPLPSKKSADLMVVCQNIDDGTFFTCKWNHFFSTTKVDGEIVPRFEEQKDYE